VEAHAATLLQESYVHQSVMAVAMAKVLVYLLPLNAAHALDLHGVPLLVVAQVVE